MNKRVRLDWNVVHEGSFRAKWKKEGRDLERGGVGGCSWREEVGVGWQRRLAWSWCKPMETITALQPGPVTSSLLRLYSSCSSLCPQQALNRDQRRESYRKEIKCNSFGKPPFTSVMSSAVGFWQLWWLCNGWVFQHHLLPTIKTFQRVVLCSVCTILKLLASQILFRSFFKLRSSWPH